MKRRIVVVVGIVVLAAAALWASKWFRRGEKISADGTLEARNIEIGSKVGGRITQVLAQEGDRVEAGKLLITFDSDELEGQLLQARGRYAQARANYDKMLRGNRPEDITESRATKRDREAEVQQAKSDLARAKADYENAEVEFKRYQGLADEGVVSRQQRDAAELRRDAARAAVAAAEHAVNAAEERYSAAGAAQQRTEKGFRVEDIAAAKADLVRAEGELKQAEARWAEREVHAPANATIEVMDIRPGDLIPANTAVARLLEADQLYVIVYVPQDRIGKIQVGQKAQVFVDAFPKQGFPATVEQIRQKAEFLPRNVQTPEEREHQVIGVKLRVDNHENKLRAGVHAAVNFEGVAQ
jgi:multidrug resistance efflux pump